jgi:hypothetical protein
MGGGKGTGFNCRIGGTAGVVYTNKTLEWCNQQGGELRFS